MFLHSFSAFIVLLAISSGAETSLQSPKKGLVVPYWPNHKCGDFENFETISWWYNYHTHPDPRQCNNNRYKWWCVCKDGDKSECFPKNKILDYVPMVQGAPGKGNHPTWNEPKADDEFQFLLGFNEPNQADQSDLTPEEAAIEWMAVQLQYPSKTLVGPAIAAADMKWFDRFWAKCQELGCRIDHLAVHMYDGDTEKIMARLEEFSKRYDNKPIWLTEFAVMRNHNENEIVAFIEEILPRLEAAPFVFRYAWFITRYYPKDTFDGWFWIDPINSLLEQDSSFLTDVGKAYDYPYHLYI